MKFPPLVHGLALGVVAWGLFACLSTTSDFPVTPAQLSPQLPADIPGGAPNATLEAAATFAWQEFIALNWPAVVQTGAVGERGRADARVPFGSTPGRPLTWETFRGRVEIYPGQGAPHGYANTPGGRFGYDALPQYIYDASVVGSYPGLPAGSVPPDVGQAPVAQPAWISLDEDNEIQEDAMFAGVAAHLPYPGAQFLYAAKANIGEYAYIASNGWWGEKPVPADATALYVLTNKATPAPGTPGLVSFPTGTVEIKSAWRQLTTAEAASGRWHTSRVRYYVPQVPGQTYGGRVYKPLLGQATPPAWREDELGLAGLHIIHKTPSAPYFVYATFEHADNILTAAGEPVEDATGRVVRNQDLTPEDPVIESTPATATSDQVLTAKGPFGPPGERLYFKNLPAGVPAGPVSINRRVHAIPQAIIDVNAAFQSAIVAYEAQHGIASPWRNYKLVNVQWVPLDKATPGAPYTGPNVESYYLSNSVVETDTNLQTFSGKLANPAATNGLITDFYNKDNNTIAGQPRFPVGMPATNVPFAGRDYNMGGCMGCHGNIAQLGTDFSFILVEGRFKAPETKLDYGQAAASNQ